MKNEGKNEEVAENWSQSLPVCLGPCCDAGMRQPTAGLWTSISDINRIDGSIQTHSDEAVLQQNTFSKVKTTTRQMQALKSNTGLIDM